ncbi:MAG: TrkH family potassium uptake protein [Bacteroidota bacterium]
MNQTLKSRTSFNRPVIDVFSVLGVLGAFVFFLGFALLIPMLIAFLFEEPVWHAFLSSAMISFVVGGGLYYFFNTEQELRIREGFLIVSCTWLFLSLVGALPFVISGILPSYTDAVFETMSGLTTTGATILGGTTTDGFSNPEIESLPKSMLFWRSLAHWLGGMGIIVLSIAILPLLGIGGMQLFQAESPGPTADKLTPRVQETAKLLWVVYVSFTTAEFLLLWLHPSMDWFEAINHAFATLATGGFSTQNASIESFDSVYVDSVITLFMFLAGVNFAMHFRLLRGDTQSFLQNRELRFYSLITVLGILGITAGLWLGGDFDLGSSLRYGSFQAVSIITTTGFGTSDYELWAPFAMFLLFLLFFTGGSAGSTGGGVKMIRWLILIKNSFREIRQIIHPKAILPIRLGKQIVDADIQRTVLSFVILYIFIFGLGALVMALLGFDMMSAIGASIACLGNIGPGWGEFGPTDNYAAVPYVGKWVLILLMMIGRLEIFTILAIFAPTFWQR